MISNSLYSTFIRIIHIFSDECRSLLHTFKNLSFPIVSVSEEGTKQYPLEFYLSVLFNYLTIDKTLNKQIEIVHGQIPSIFGRYSSSSELDNYLPTNSLYDLLGSVNPINIVQLLKLILLERKILLVKTEWRTTALVIESLLQLMAPLYKDTFSYHSRWPYTNISFVTFSMLDFIDMPTPYMIGVPRSVWEKIKDNQLQSDIVVVDLDNNLITTDEVIPELPANIISPILNTLNEAWVGVGQKLVSH